MTTARRRRPHDGRRSRRHVRPERYAAPVFLSVALLLAWAGVAHASGSGWVQAIGAIAAGVIAVGMIGPGLLRPAPRGERHRLFPRREGGRSPLGGGRRRAPPSLHRHLAPGRGRPPRTARSGRSRPHPSHPRCATDGRRSGCRRRHRSGFCGGRSITSSTLPVPVEVAPQGRFRLIAFRLRLHRRRRKPPPGPVTERRPAGSPPLPERRQPAPGSLARLGPHRHAHGPRERATA